MWLKERTTSSAYLVERASTVLRATRGKSIPTLATEGAVEMHLVWEVRSHLEDLWFSADEGKDGRNDDKFLNRNEHLRVGLGRK